MSDTPVILWFRADLRLADHAALNAALERGGSVVPVFILDDDAPGAWALGGASRWWLHHSLMALAADIAKRGNALVLRRGDTVACLMDVVAETGAKEICWSRNYEPWARALEDRLKAACDDAGCTARRFSGRLLVEPEHLATQAGEPYRVYTPFWRALAASYKPAQKRAAPRKMPSPKSKPKSDTLADWALLPRTPDWAGGLRGAWQPGEAGASARLDAFLDAGLARYATDRDRPDIDGTSRLSPYLAFGEISPAALWRRAEAYAVAHDGHEKGLTVFLKELVWREFSHHLLFHFPTLPETAFREAFNSFPWARSSKNLKAWQTGQTGYPIVDAGMRQLWQTGYMHNRVRMVVASFLIKHLLIRWQDGEAWFWDTLVDADLANNAASWQWVAGSGADAAPYFRIFNPVLQGEKFDRNGDYVRAFVPELAKLPDKFLHAPWTAPADVLAKAGVTLGTTYPAPIVDHSAARARALAAYGTVKGE